MYCTRCRSHIADGSMFCEYCGQPVSTPAAGPFSTNSVSAAPQILRKRSSSTTVLLKLILWCTAIFSFLCYALPFVNSGLIVFLDGFYMTLILMTRVGIGNGMVIALMFCILSVVMLGCSGMNRMFYIVTGALALAAVISVIIGMFTVWDMIGITSTDSTSGVEILLRCGCGCYLFILSMLATAVLSFIVFRRQE